MVDKAKCRHCAWLVVYPAEFCKRQIAGAKCKFDTRYKAPKKNKEKLKRKR